MRRRKPARPGSAALLLSVLLCSASFPCAHAAPPERSGEDDHGIVNAVFENDVFAGTDQNYTNGVRLAWLSSEAGVPEAVHRLSAQFLPVKDAGKKRVSVALGQSIFTPRDIRRATLNPDDRPYAGWLYASAGLVSDTGRTLDNIQLTVGVVGPHSYARQTQIFVHKVIDSPRPRGWSHQLATEPGVMLTYERKWRNMLQYTPFGVGVDFTPHIGGHLGNVYTDAALGGTVRIGYDLPADYGPPRIRPSLPGSDFFLPTRHLGGYLFAGAEGRAVGRNLFLDGTDFSGGHRVDKNHFVGGLQAGAAITYGQARLSYTHVFMTREFRNQPHPAQFGAITLSYRF